MSAESKHVEIEIPKATHARRHPSSTSTEAEIKEMVASEVALLETYQRRATVNALAHEIAAVWYLCVNRVYLGYPGTVFALLSTILSTQIVGECDPSPSDYRLRLAIAVSTAVAAFFVTTVSFLGYERIAIDHNTSADQYADLAGDIELFLSTRNRTNNAHAHAELEAFLRTQHAVMEIYDKGAPKIHNSFEKQAKARCLAGKKHVSGRCKRATPRVTGDDSISESYPYTV